MIDSGTFAKALQVMGFTKESQESNVYFIEGNTWRMSADFDTETLIYPENVRGREHNTSFSAPENFVVFECVYRLLRMGYRPGDIELEKEWRLGHVPKSGRADICVYDKDNPDSILMIIECKTAGSEYSKALRDTQTDGGQLFSYWQQESSAKWLVLYASDFKDGKLTYNSPAINCTDDKNLIGNPSDNGTTKFFRDAQTAREKFEVWKETYNSDFREDIIFSPDSVAYDIGTHPLRKRNLTIFTEESKKGIINKFEEILRHNNVSDKENAFNRLIALFICKLVDEYSKNDDDELAFQYIPRRDTYEDLQDRLQKLYHEGMLEFMREKITYIPADYPKNFMAQYNGGDRVNAIRELADTFRRLKYFTNNDFAFLDVHNEALFYKNGKILVEVVQLFEQFRIVHTEQHQLLGDLFEQLLDQGFRQNEGQFFTPIPLARFIWDSLPLKRYESWPKVIDYACGAGHFLTEAIEAINHFIPSEGREWTRDCIFGIEKDYRLARVSKVSMFMNGAGDSNIIFGDGLENSSVITPGAFDILTANPPYSVASFKQHLRFTSKDFTLWDKISPSSSEIEVLFIERIGQLLKDSGIAAVILPSSILSNDSLSYTGAREELLCTFMIRAVVKLGSKTFGATGTNTVILFLERYLHHPSRMCHVNDSLDAIFADRNLDLWEDKEILAGYLAMQGLTREQWRDFVHDRFTPETMPEYFRMYHEAYGENFSRRAKIIEREKLKYYALTYSQKTTVIIAPSDNAGQREFLGYWWSNRKGDEGIHYDGERGGKMYVNSDREAAGTLADVVRQSFGDGDVVMTEDNARYARVVETWRMLDFSRVNFNVSIELNEQRKNTISSSYELLKLEAISTIIAGQSPESQYYNKAGNGMPFYQGKKEFGLRFLQNATIWTTRTTKLSVKGDILMSVRAPVGSINENPFDEICIGRGLTAIRANEKVDRLYLYYFLVSIQDSISGHDGAVFDSISQSEVKNIKIPLPPMEIQCQAVSECEKIDAEYNTTRMSMEDYKTKIQAIFHRLGIILPQP